MMHLLRIQSLLIATMLLIPALAGASISLPLPWKLGDSHRYQSVTVQEKVRAGKSQSTQTREIYQISIVEAGPKGFLQVWRAESTSSKLTGDGENMAAEQELLARVQDRFRDLPLDAELDADGAYVRLRNWKVLGEALREVTLPVMVKQAMARPGLEKSDAETVRATMLPVLERMTTEHAIGSTMGKHVAIYNFFTAASIKAGEPVVYQDYLPSPWSADLIPTQGSFRLTGSDERAGTVTIVWKQSIDPVKGAPVMWKIVEALVGQPMPDKTTTALPEGLSLSDEATVVIDRKSGLPLSLVHQRKVEAGTSRTTNTWTLDKLPD